MRMPMGNLWGWLYHRRARLFSDIGTASLGIAALFFVRAFPPSASFDFDIWMLLPSAFFFVSGLALRVIEKP